MRIRLMLVVCALLIVDCAEARTVGKRRALLVGIDDYSASRIGARPERDQERDWPDLRGAGNDVRLLKQMLILRHGFAGEDVVTLVDQDATRAAILERIEQHLIKPAKEGDVLLFYFAGHGSQVPNSRSKEPDRLDESIVPADSRAGAHDIRDKELRRAFNRVLDRGARLTVILDNCHSGSGARGLPFGAGVRGIAPDLRDVADPEAGPRIEDRGALVLAGAEDFDRAFETKDEDNRYHGAFSWAWIRAMRDAAEDESASDTFDRASARLASEKPFQEAVISGNDDARHTPFLGTKRQSRRRSERTTIAVESVSRDGTILLRGGWAHGLTVGSELRLADNPNHPLRLKITALRDLGASEARLASGGALPSAVHSGALLEVAAWAAPPLKPLRVFASRVAGDLPSLTATARALAGDAKRRGIRWIQDPIDQAPSHVLRATRDGWELIATARSNQRVAIKKPGDALAKLPAGSSLFVQLPAPASLIEAIDIGPNSEHEEIATVNAPEDADYLLVGRFTSNRIEYAWLRATVPQRPQPSTARRGTMPLRSAWSGNDSAETLRDGVLSLNRIHAWMNLESPPGSQPTYRLSLRGSDGKPAGKTIRGEEDYSVVLRATGHSIAMRYAYVFAVDEHGQSALLYPVGGGGSLENRFPLNADQPATNIDLGGNASFRTKAPYGVDTYFLLLTDEPLSDPWILQWKGVRSPGADASPLERLLLLTGNGSRRGAPIVTPATWSIERLSCESIPPPRKRSAIEVEARH